ncbi:type VII secretion integral membrane protein EccD [Planosporangium flavigriseum]|uniref:Type VII secretion integral membrane protein EccD n=1 Tax=Planosporangium flavigriseum TaxID=373681 RepID=A0A8J3LUA6_9ACTN|nr:type VII secretion integral membrane protein EccD [Planosporangium flavigriseum]NJC63756.1 type VII secretion integral membrane protein EccD [Planosporangium flavigriseum]GIG73746.1 type VII secretion integral membrane protein EccD [Planosporangium flavigriseum]
MPAPSTGLARVTISSPQRRVDVALPDGVPLAELLPELLAHAGEGLADDGERHGGWLLRRGDGTALSTASPLSAQGVRDGAVLHLVPARVEWPELEYDDVVEAIAAGARRYGVGWSDRASRATGLVAAGIALAIGLAAVLRSGPPWTVPGLVALGVCVLLLVVGAVASRAYGDGPVGATLAAGALPFAFVGGLLVLRQGRGAPDEWNLLVGATILLLVALIGVVGVGYALRLFVAGATAGVLGAVAAAIGHFTSAAGAAAALLALLVAGISVVPLIAIRLGKLPMPATTLPADVSASGQGLEPQPERQRVFAAVARTDEILTGMLLGLTVAGVAASLLLSRTGGLATGLLVAVASGALLLRARLFVTIRQRLPLLAAGIAGFALLAARLFITGGAGMALGGAFGVAVLAVLVALAGARYAQRSPSPYLGRAADVLDALCVVSVLPIACAVLELYSLVRTLTS